VRILDVPEERAEAVLAALRADPGIQYAERDGIARAAFTPNDPYVLCGREWHLFRIQAPQAWNFTTGNPSVVVAILDSGIDAMHPDLQGRVLPGYDFVWGNTNAADDFGHGTAVAGVVAANGDNGIGVAGLCYNCSLLPVKVMDVSGLATYSSIAQGIQYAVDQGARVINISIAGDSVSSTLQDAVDYAWSNNVVVVAAAGNNANDTPQYPAACNHVVAVAATEPDDSLAPFSSYGSYLTLAAPGDNIWTTQRTASSPYGAWRGTSFASPVVAAVAALEISANPLLSNTQIVSILGNSADRVGSAGYNTSFGYGRVNALRAVLAANPEFASTNLVSMPPTVTVTSPNDFASFPVGATISLDANASSTTSSVTNVFFLLNDAPIIPDDPSPFAATWIGSLPGSYSVAAVAIDDQGLTSTSPPVSIVIGAESGGLATLRVSVTGAGKVVPDLDGAQLRVGKSYTLRAVPAWRQMFAGWEGAVSNTPLLHFVMQPGLSLTANFVPTPFPVVSGSYAGLALNTNVLTADNSGFFRITVTSMGRFSGRVLNRGRGYAFHGQFNLTGDSSITVKRGQLAPLSLNLHLALEAPTDQVKGTLTDGVWASELSGDRNIFNAPSNPALQAGLHSFVLQPSNSPQTPAATGVSRISRGGRAAIHGKLTTGQSFGIGTSIAKNGDCPFYVSWERGNQIVIGWLNFPSQTTPLASGTVQWFNTGANAFATTLNATSVH
jgi:hypothetical protein